MRETVLGADIGGTKTLISLAAVEDGKPRFLRSLRYANDDFEDFYALLARFLQDWSGPHAIARACLGVAGPREGDSVRLTNRPWTIHAERVSHLLGGASTVLANDFEAAAYGVELLEPHEMQTLQAGEPVPRAPQVVIGAGTGLGIAYRIWSGAHYRVIPGEGGHMGFAPNDEDELRVWRALHAEHGRVSAEHLVSGAGIARIYSVLGGPAVLPVEVSRLAIERGDPLAHQALGIFARCYGAVAGDHALAVLARGGVFLAGGIAPKLAELLQASGLLPAFNAKGRHSSVAQRMPLHIVLNEQLGLLGAILIAARP